MTSPSFYQIRQCENAACGLRYPLTEDHPFGERCPLCLGATRMEIQRPLTADKKFETQPPISTAQPIKIEAMLDNVRSAWNVGAIFRTADAFGVSHIHLGGITPTPGNASVAKTALGADKTIGWSHAKNGLAMAEKLKADGYQLWALEQDERARSIYNTFSDLRFGDLVIENQTSHEHDVTKYPAGTMSPNTLRARCHQMVLIVGNEVTGVDPGLLDLCDKILYIPMRGEKRSLNVEVAFGVAVSWLMA